MLTSNRSIVPKTIHAFALLDALAARELEFVFKGGTSLLLRLPHIRRLSIDADIFCHEPAEKLDRLLAEISRTRPFTGMTEDDRGEHRIPARRHFKFSYTPLNPKNPAPFVLLDVVHERNLYPRVERVPLRTAFVEGDGALFVPTVEGLLGDKLTAFGPNTTGVALNEQYTMQFTKQVFDIGELFNAATDIAAVRAAYDQVFAAENGYRGGRFTAELALQDALDTAYRIAQVGFASAPCRSGQTWGAIDTPVGCEAALRAISDYRCSSVCRNRAVAIAPIWRWPLPSPTQNLS